MRNTEISLFLFYPIFSNKDSYILAACFTTPFRCPIGLLDLICVKQVLISKDSFPNLLFPVFPISVSGNLTHLVSQAKILDACVILDYVLSLILYSHYISRSCFSTIKIHAESDHFLLLLHAILFQMAISHLHSCNSSKVVISWPFKSTFYLTANVSQLMSSLYPKLPTNFLIHLE